MKKLLSLFTFLLFCHHVIAQQPALRIKTTAMTFDSAVNYTIQQMQSIKPYDTTEGGEINQFKRWAEFQKNRIAYDAPTDSNILEPAGKALEYYLKNTSQYCSSNGAYQGTWRCLGPYKNYHHPDSTEKQGRIDAVWADPNNIGYMLAGSNQGGLWKTTDTGRTWRNITDPKSGSSQILPGTFGANHIAVNPLDQDLIYIATNVDQTYHKHWGYALGLSYTTDGGQTWNADDDFLTANAQAVYDYKSKFVRKLAYMPGTDKLFAITGEKVLYKSSAVSSWTEITPTSPMEYTDFEFTVLNPGKMVVSTKARNGFVEFWTFIPSTYQWSQVQLQAPAGYDFEDNTTSITNFTITGADSVYYLLDNAYNTSTNVYHKFLNRGTLTAANTHSTVQNIGPSTFSVLHDFVSIHASPTHSNLIYGARANGQNSFYESTDWGASFFPIQGSTHGDARYLTIYHSGASNDGGDDILLGGSDGGVVIKRAGDWAFESITGDSLVITQLYSLSNTEQDDRLIVGGSQDNGAFSYMKNRVQPWISTIIGDGFNSKFTNNGRRAYIQGWPNWNQSARFNFGTTGLNHTGLSDAPGSAENFLRPMYFNAANEFYWGHNVFWVNNDNVSTTWNPAFSSEPHTGRFAGDVAMSEPNNDTVYIAYQQNTNNPASDGRLFFTFNSQNTPPSWANITPPQVQWNRINDIEVNKKNLKHIWVVLGDVSYWNTNTPPAQMNGKVYYSNNYGSNWFDISKGLPALPVNKILYHDGSNRLFVGTDVGVFTCDFNTFNPSATLVNGVNTSVEWKCFNHGMPPVIVTDMEFNHCAGKLRIATFGRGIWETNIMVDPYPANNPPTFFDEFRPIQQEVITSNTTWNSDKYIHTGIRITNGATLTIENNGSDTTVIHMPKNGVILVEKGATLVVDGARITNSCEDCMWTGISVVGTNHTPQTLTYQGKLTLKNGAVLEHARVAVGNSFIDDPNRYNNTGGIIQATNAAFLNNGRAVEFLAYNDASTLNDQSFFRNCRFAINDEYKGASVGYPFEHHVTMWDVHGVEFNGCTFVNNHTTSQKNKGDGIYAYDASFYVRPYILGGSQPGNRFDSLKHGIVVDAGMYGWPLSPIIDRNSFSANSVGLKIINIPDVSAIRNTFTVGNGKGIDLFDCEDNIGIYTENTTRFRIEENTFIGTTGTAKIADNSVGTLVVNSGTNDKEIYKNSYTNLDFGVFAQGNNTSYIGKKPSDQKGLRILCNTFTTNDYDINVTGNPLNKEGICYWQGSYVNVAGVYKTVSAGNSFMTSTSTHINNTASNFNYYHYNSVSVPTNITGLAAVFVADIANECASKLSTATEPDRPVELTETMKTATKTLFWDSKSQRDSRQNTWLGLIDNGNTNGMITTVLAKHDTAARNYLLTYSPYISSTVIKEVAANGIMSKALLKEVLVENQDLLRDWELIVYLSSEAVADPLNGTDIEEFYEFMLDETPRTRLEAAISSYQAKMSDAVNLLLTDIKCKDAITEEDSIVVWLGRMGEQWADYQEAYYLLNKGEHSEAIDVMEIKIPQDYTLTGTELNENLALTAIGNIFIDINENERTIYDLDSMEVVTLSAIEALDLPNSSSLARSILTLTGYHVMPCIDLPISSSRPALQKGKSVIRKRGSSFSVYPNPASEYMIFEYKLENDEDPIQITITNTVGQQVGSFELKSNATGKYYWDIRHLPAGNYFYKANNNKKDYGSGKIVVVH